MTYRTASDVKTKEILYTYDVYDRRIRKQVDSNGNGTIDSSASFVYDAGVKGALTDILFVIDGSSNITHRYLHGPMIDQPLAEEHSSGTYWLLAGHLGTITDVIEYASGTDTTTVVNSLEYNSFGGITSETDSTKTPHYTFTGREWDEDADLYYYRARWYDAKAGRFISEDPIGFEAEDSNLSRYVNNSPFAYVDADGLNPIAIPVAGGAVISASEILGISAFACVITPACIELAIQIASDIAKEAAYAACTAACHAEYLLVAAACQRFRSIVRRRSCYASAADDLGTCIANCTKSCK